MIIKYSKKLVNPDSQSLIGILTFHYSTNYGALLQAYCLRLFLSQIGYRVEIVDYRPLRAIRTYARIIFLNKNLFSGIQKLIKISRFINKKLVVSEQKAYTRERLASIVAKYSALVVGSDEVWKLNSFRGYDSSFFLNFPGLDIRKLSFAASTGGENTFGRYRTAVSNALSGFQGVSVRDDISANSLLDHCNVRSTRLLDPTLLVDMPIATNNLRLPENFFVVYGQATTDELAKIREYAAESNSLLISVGYYNKGVDINRLGVSVEEWLACLKYSRAVFTNFFHGTIFSLKLKREAFVLDRPDKRYKIHQLIRDLALVRSDNEDSGLSSILRSSGIYRLSCSDSYLELVREGRIKAIEFVKQSLAGPPANR